MNQTSKCSKSLSKVLRERQKRAKGAKKRTGFEKRAKARRVEKSN